eukprot:3881618-Pleurochrysis_carterae.AAC.1
MAVPAHDCALRKHPTSPMLFKGISPLNRVRLGTCRSRCRRDANVSIGISPFPVILSLEMHCSLPQQETIAEILIEARAERLRIDCRCWR